MNSMALQIIVVLWAASISIIIIVLIRQVSLISVRLNLQMRLPDMSEYGTGPELGTLIPESVSNAVPRTVTILALEGTCGPCHELAAALPSRAQDLIGTLAIFLAGKGRPTEELKKVIPSWVKVIEDPDATQLSREMNLSRTRWALRLHNGVVVGHADVSDINNLRELMASELPDLFKISNERNI